MRYKLNHIGLRMFQGDTSSACEKWRFVTDSKGELVKVENAAEPDDPNWKVTFTSFKANGWVVVDEISQVEETLKKYLLIALLLLTSCGVVRVHTFSVPFKVSVNNVTRIEEGILRIEELRMGMELNVEYYSDSLQLKIIGAQYNGPNSYVTRTHEIVLAGRREPYFLLVSSKDSTILIGYGK